MLIVIVYFLIAFSSFYILSMVEESYFFQKYVDKVIKYEEVKNLSNAVIKLVKNSLKKDNPKIDYLGETWAKPITIPLPNGKVDITIIDQERYLNPNFLINEKGINQTYFSIFQRLYLMLNIDEFLIYNLIDWIDKNDTSDGGEEEYENYKAKNNKLDSIEEILLVKGYSPKILYGDKNNNIPPLKDFLTVYSNGKININTAPKLVLKTLDLDDFEIDQILEERENKPFSSLEDFKNRIDIDISKFNKIKNLLDVKSENFLVVASIFIEDKKYKLIFLLKRGEKKFQLVWKRLY